MTEINVGGINYRIGKLPAMQQLHVTRRIGPVLATMGVSVLSAIESGKMQDSEDSRMLDLMATAMDVVAHMTNDDVEYVVNTCLAVTQRQQGERWAPVMNGQRMMFQDVDMRTMVQLTVGVLQENLGGFFQGAGANESMPPAS